MGSQPRRTVANTKSLSLWQTCWSLRPWQDEKKGLYLIQWCFSWTLKSCYNLVDHSELFCSCSSSRLHLATIGFDWLRTKIVKRCDVCQLTSNKLEKPAQLCLIKVKDTVWHRIGIDLVGPLPETFRGNKYLITCTCYFSKWPEAAPLKGKSAEGM